MILAVDIGNTHIRVGAWDRENLVFVARLQTSIRKTMDEYAISLLDILKLNKCNSAQFDGGIISSVVPQLSTPFREAVMTLIQSRRVYVISPGVKTGLNIRIDNPATLGADMVCGAVAALNKYPMPCIIINMGTATTLFALDDRGAFLGGSVMAGVNIALEALSRKTAQLPHISMDEPGDLIATNTVDCMKSGVLYGTACMLDGMIGRMREQLGEKTTVVASGDQASQIIGQCREEIILDGHLVLEGLRMIYHKNTRQAGE